MKLFAISVLVIALLGGMLFAAAKSNPKNDISFSEVQTAVNDGARYYDVRTPAEFAAGHFASAINLPLGDIQSGVLPDVPKGTKIYVQCQSGNRSAQATRLLKSAGFTNITDLGGISDVQRIGGKLET